MPRQKYISPISLLAKRFPLPQKARVPRNRPQGITRQQYVDHFRDVAIALFGLSHTVHTRVGNEYIRGVSGGERKRVSIAEAFLAGCTLQCWYLIFFLVSLKLCLTTMGACLNAVTLTSQREYNANWLNRDNSTRGLDSATTLKFVKMESRLSSEILSSVATNCSYSNKLDGMLKRIIRMQALCCFDLFKS